MWLYKDGVSQLMILKDYHYFYNTHSYHPYCGYLRQKCCFHCSYYWHKLLALNLILDFPLSLTSQVDYLALYQLHHWSPLLRETFWHHLGYKSRLIKLLEPQVLST
ncbi:hypothetical protein ACB098_09G088400 [Castanea mollissima]